MNITEQYTTIDEKRIFYRCFLRDRQYPWLIFLHEALGSTTQFYNFPQQVAEQLQVNILVYDRWGHGKSNEQLHQRAIDFHHHEVDFLSRLLAELGITEFYCIGHSDGGVIALLSATRQIQGLKGTISISAMSERSNELVDIIHQTIDKEAFNQVRIGLNKHHHGKEQQVIDNWVNTWGVTDLKKIGLLDSAHNIRVPVLIIHGVHDQYGDAQHLHRLVAKIPHAEQQLLSDSKHHPHLEEGEKVAQLISQFLISNGVNVVKPMA